MKTVLCTELVELIESQTYRLIDVRSQEEFDTGHIKGAELLPLSLISVLASERLADKDQLLILCCASGGRAMFAATELEKLGYTNVSVLEGGYEAWCTVKQ